MSDLEYRVGDVFDRLAEIPDDSIDLIVSSPPFLALRSYLPDDHPNKHREIGSEPTPAAFLDTHLALSAEYARVLAPHGSLCYEIGDTYSGSGGAGGDYNADGLREGQGKFIGSARRGGDWPLAKSMCIIPHLFTASLAYGRNLLTGEPSPSGDWRIRNVICWARPNPPVGALGDKFRPATSYITVACKGAKRYFDLDAVRYAPQDQGIKNTNGPKMAERFAKGDSHINFDTRINSNPAGAPPLDWHTDDHPEDGDWLWKLSTQPYKGAHFATFNMTLPKRLIEAMCPLRVCDRCGPVYLHHDQTGPPNQDVRGMRPDVSAGRLDSARGAESNSQESVLFSDVLQSTHGTHSVVHQGVRHHQEGLQDTAQTEAPDGNEDRLRDGTPLSDGGTRGSRSDGGRGGASPQRGQARQSDRESGTTPEAGSRSSSQAGPEAAPVPLVRESGPDASQCPTCKGPTRVGRVLDPFAGSGTTLEAAQAVGRSAIGIDIDSRNADLAQERVGMFLAIDHGQPAA